MNLEPQLLNGDCLMLMHDLPANSIDAIVTDPPYALTGTSGTGGFMGAKWDSELPTVEMWKEALRVAKPGAHLLAFGGTRTYHRLACAIEDAGWEIRDCCFWCHGQGFPKSLDVSKAIDKMLGAERTEVIGHENTPDMRGGNLMASQGKARLTRDITAPATPEAVAWSGWGTALKPACEPIVIARKPLEGTVAANVIKYGTGAINIDACRVPLAADDKLQDGVKHNGNALDTQNMGWGFKSVDRTPGLGRFPANLIHDGSDEVLALFPDSKGQCGAVKGNEPSELTRGIYGKFSGDRLPCTPRGDLGSAARFFYCAKASRGERGEGNIHPTVKPLALMRYLVTLVTPEGATVLDPFMGSGTTGVAAAQLSRRFIGMEKDNHYFAIARARVDKALAAPRQCDLDL